MEDDTPHFTRNLIGLSWKSLERFEAKFAIDESRPSLSLLGPCWRWTGSVTNYGHGQVTITELSDTPIPIHRLAYVLEIGPIPEGGPGGKIHIHHKCEYPPCGRPSHIEALTVKQHWAVSQGHNANATHCIRGHEFTEENTYRTKSGHRHCRACRHLRAVAEWGEYRKANPLPEKTHCKSGHILAGTNLYTWLAPDGRILRRCLTCKIEARKRHAPKQAEWYAANAETINLRRREARKADESSTESFTTE